MLTLKWVHMETRRTHVVIPEVRRLEQLRSLGDAVGCWKDENHPELKDGADKWVEKLRDEAEGRSTF